MNTPQILVFDSDGVLSSGGIALPHAQDLISELNEKGHPYYILTNNPFLDAQKKSDGYRQQGFEIAPERIFGAAHPLERVLKDLNSTHGALYAVGVEDPSHMLHGFGYDIDNKSQDVDGILLLDDDHRWDADRVADILDLLMAQPNLPLIVPNPDLVYPDRPGHLYCTTGAWVDMLLNLCAQKGRDIQPIYLGKPYAPIYQCLQEELHAHFPKIKGDQITMLGDSPATDILGANRQGWRSALIKTGNFHYGADRLECRATETHEDLASFRKQATWMDGAPIQNH
jgi:NagD protein